MVNLFYTITSKVYPRIRWKITAETHERVTSSKNAVLSLAVVKCVGSFAKMR